MTTEPRVTPRDRTAHELAGALLASEELGTEYAPAVAETFLEELGARIDQRVDERLATTDRGQATRPNVALLLGSIALGIPVTGAATAFENGDGLLVALAAWLTIAVTNIAAARR
jgi:hypothetical protein